MGIIIQFLGAAAKFLAGVGVAELLDKFIKPKVPANYYPETVSPGFKVPKVFWLILAFGIAFIALKWLAKKLKVSFLK